MSVVSNICDTLKTVFSYLRLCKESKVKKQQEKYHRKTNDKIDAAIDKGTLRELLDTICMTLFASIAVGCSSQSIQIVGAESWEQHYLTVDEFKEGTKDIQLEKRQSVWVISNTTFKRILKEIRQKEKYEQ